MSKLLRVGIVHSGVLKEVQDASQLDLKTLEGLVGANTGNLAFTYPIDRLIDNPVERIPWNFDIESAREKFDVLWFACANMLGSHCDLGWVADHLEQTGLPVIAVGLGAQNRSTHDLDCAITPGTLRWLLTLERLSPSGCNIFCRGQYTDSILKGLQLGYSTSGCCPSLFISSDSSLGETIARRALDDHNLSKPFAVYSGFIGNHSLYSLEQSLVQLLETTNQPGIYISQHGKTLLSLSEPRFRDQLSEEQIQEAKEMIMPMASDLDFLSWCDQHAKTFYSVDEWMDSLKNFSASTGMRFHGNMLSLQAGIPSVCITIDSRTEELCRSCLVPSMTTLEFKHVSSDILRRVFNVRFNPAEFDANRSLMARKFMSFLLANNLTPSRHLQSLASAHLPLSKQAQSRNDIPVPV
jgi:hypothetical protein